MPVESWMTGAPFGRTVAEIIVQFGEDPMIGDTVVGGNSRGVKVLSCF